MNANLKVRKNDILAVMYIYMTSAFYILRYSNLFIPEMRILLLIAIMSGLLYFALNIRFKCRFKIWLVAFAVIIVVIFISRRDTRLMVSFVAILVGIRMKRENLLRALFHSKLIFFIIAMLTGGIGHINGVAMQLGSIILICIAFWNEKINNKQLLFLWLLYLGGAIYMHTGAFIVSIGIALFFVSTKKYKITKRILLSFFSRNIYPIMLAFNVIGSLWVGEQYYPSVKNAVIPFIRETISYVMDKIDRILSWRLTLAAESLHRYGISVIGGNVKYDSLVNEYGVYFNLDSGLMWLLQGWGGIITFIFMVLMVIMMSQLVKRKEYNLIIVGMSIAMWAMVEDMLVSIGVNFMFYILGETLVKEVRKRKLSYGDT